uniref:Conotoxin superfamily F n=1 Tax=Conus magus TaxID=6492 RepID=A0A5P8I0J3_CONMA|nr:conotoxin superfamily F [Conus magus]
MQRGAVLLGVVAFLALWPQAAARVYDLNEPDVWGMVDYAQRAMHSCAIVNDYDDRRWSSYNVAEFKDRSLFRTMVTDLQGCLNYFFQIRP